MLWNSHNVLFCFSSNFSKVLHKPMLYPLPKMRKLEIVATRDNLKGGCGLPYVSHFFIMIQWSIRLYFIESQWNMLYSVWKCLGYRSQPCTQRNIFGSHWLLNVQTLVATANMNFSENKYHTLQILLVSTEALFTSSSTIHMPHHHHPHHHLCSA